MNYYFEMFTKAFDFKGKSNLKQFWFAVLFDMIASICVEFLALPFIFDFAVFQIVANSLTSLYSLIVLIPTLSLTVRRLHDTGHTGWMILITIIPLIGLIILIYILCQPSVYTTKPMFNDVNNNSNEMYGTETQTDDNVNTKNDDFADTNQNQNNENVFVNTEKDSQNIAENEIDDDEINKNDEEPILITEDKVTITTVKKTRVERIRESQKLLEDGKITKEEYERIVRKILTE